MTKREMYEAIKAGAATGEWTISETELVEFCDKEIEFLDKKAAKAKEASAKRKAEGDALTALVKAALTDEFQTIADVTAVVVEGDAEATVAKVTYRISQLVKNGEAIRDEAKITDGDKSRTVKVYKLAN